LRLARTRGHGFLAFMEAAVVATNACAWPVLTRLDAASLGVVHFNQPSHGLQEGDLAALTSADEGRTWQSAGLAAPHDPGANRMHIASGVAHDGSWLVLSTGFNVVDGRYGSQVPLWCSRRMPGARDWTIERSVRLEGVPARAIPHGRILALPDGRLAATCYCSWGRGKPGRAWIVFSQDLGATWSGASSIGADDANEVCLLRRNDGGMIAVARTHVDHHVTLHTSADAGATWQRRGDMTMPMQHPADLADLGDEGILVTYGIRNRGLMGVGLRLSRDGGETWSPPAVLYQFGEASDCGYPSTVALRDGELLTACYTDRSALHKGYHLLTIRWRLDEMFTPRALRSMSDGGPLQL
jgi:hypothetical protein